MKELTVESIDVHYEKRAVLRELTFAFSKGNIYVILGPNGAGKSTFLKVLGKLISPSFGKVIYLEKNLKDYSLKEYARLRAYLPQRDETVPHLTVREVVLFGRMPHFSSEPSLEDQRVVDHLLESFGIKDLQHRFISELSGGEYQRVMLARAFAQDPEILLLDEPINHLDPKNQIEILRIVRNLTVKKKLITVIVLHDINLAISFGDHFIFIKNGNLMAHGDSSVITPELLFHVYDWHARVYNLDGRPLVSFEIH